MIRNQVHFEDFNVTLVCSPVLDHTNNNNVISYTVDAHCYVRIMVGSKLVVAGEKKTT